jgi:signal peptidase II
MALIPEGSAVRSPRTALALAGIAALILTADQVTKALVLSGRISGDAGWAAVRLVRNTGSAGGLASGFPVLVTLAAIAITAVAGGLLLRARGRAAALFLAVILGGALGNLADRLFRGPGPGRGAVVDWIHLTGRGGSLNLADAAIQLGVLGAVVALLATREKAPGEAGGEAAARRPGG